MKQHVTHYHILGVKTDVTAAEIKRAYRSLVKSYHPDVDSHEQTQDAKVLATEQMMRLNLAYETLKDQSKRKAYDRAIGLYRTVGLAKRGQDSMDEERDREAFLKKVYHPHRHSITTLLNSYQNQLRKLSLDIYDEQLLAEFELYVQQVDSALRQAAEDLNTPSWPAALDAAVQMMRYAISQAVDGLEEMRHFSQNFDYAHLAMAGNLFVIALDLCKQSLKLVHR